MLSNAFSLSLARIKNNLIQSILGRRDISGKMKNLDLLLRPFLCTVLLRLRHNKRIWDSRISEHSNVIGIVRDIQRCCILIYNQDIVYATLYRIASPILIVIQIESLAAAAK